MVIENSPFAKASFNPIVKTYILLYVFFVLLISIIGIPIAILWILGVGQWYSKHYYDRLSCEVDSRNLKFRKGILIQIEKTIPLENIQDITFIEGPLLRLFHLCILKVETAGHGVHTTGNEMSLIGIVGAAEFRDVVMKARTQLIDRKITDNTVQERMLEVLLRIETAICNKA